MSAAPKLSLNTTVFVHAFKDHVILRGVVTGHERLDGYDKDFTQIRLDSGKNIIAQIRCGNQSSLAETFRKQNSRRYSRR